MSDFKTLALSAILSCTFSAAVFAEETSSKVDTKTIVEKAVEQGYEKLREEVDRVPGLTYEEISEVSKQIPGNVQIPDPFGEELTSRAISVPGGLVSRECKHFARGFVAKRFIDANPELSREQAFDIINNRLDEHRRHYEKIADESGLERSVVAIREADCPVCGPINAAEIACHKEAVKQSPVRELVMFDYASHKLRPQYTPLLEQIAALITEDTELKVALVGRASLPGGPVPNFKLSAKRISSVWYGLTTAGVSPENIVAIPVGEDEPHIDLQLAVEYGLEEQFTDFGQNPLNQSVNVVVFRPDENTVPRYFDVLDGEEDLGPTFTVTVTDDDATLVLTDVTITASNGNDADTTSVVTDHDGIASLSGLAPGKWTLTFDRRGYDSRSQDIEITEGEAGSATVALNATIVAFEGKQADGESNESKRKALNDFLADDTEITATQSIKPVNAVLDDNQPVEPAEGSVAAIAVEFAEDVEEAVKTEPLMKLASETDDAGNEETEKVALASDTEDPVAADAKADIAPVEQIEQAKTPEVETVEATPQETADAAAEQADDPKSKEVAEAASEEKVEAKPQETAEVVEEKPSKAEPEETAKTVSEEAETDKTIEVAAQETENIALKQEQLRLFLSGKIELDELKSE